MTLRVTAGVARGRQILIPKTDLRPTTDKVKQALFSMLEAEALRRGFEGDEDHFAAMQAWPRVLDLYAGSGALGIEALSRGADRATFIERDRIAIETIARNLDTLGLQSRSEVRKANVATSLAAIAGPYDLILLDPPYDDRGATMKVLEQIATRGLLAEQGIMLWEHRSSVLAPALPEGLRSVRRREYGATAVTLLEREPSGPRS